MKVCTPTPNWRDWIAFLKFDDQALNSNLSPHGESLWKNSPLDQCFLFNRSTTSLRLIAEALYLKNKRPLKILLPSFLCRAFFEPLESLPVEFVFYPLDDQYGPDYSFIETIPSCDIFILVHYFGRCTPAQQAKKWCQKNSALLIEDATHILRPYAGIGSQADFTLYSPYKFLPIPDGAILIQSKNELILGDDFKKHVRRRRLSPAKPWNWILKKLAQTLIPESFARKIFSRVLDFEQDPVAKGPPDMQSMSWPSVNYIHSMDHERLNTIQRDRWQALHSWEYVLGSTSAISLPIQATPYQFVLKLENELKARELYIEAAQFRLFPSTWPDRHPKAQLHPLRTTQIYFPVPQSLCPQFFNSYLKEKIALLTPRLTIKESCAIPPEELPSNLLQSVPYVQSKIESEGLDAIHDMIELDGQPLAVAHILKRKIGPLAFYRINRGPLLLRNDGRESNTLLQLACINMMLKQLGCLHGRPTIWAPDLLAIKHVQYPFKRHFIKLKLPAHESILLKLNSTFDELRKQLDSKWRNLLTSAEKANLSVVKITNEQGFEDVLHCYAQMQREQQFTGIPQALLRTLWSKGILMVFRAEADGELASYLVVATHGRTATYLIGYNNDAGRRLRANYLLLWHAIGEAKNLGFQWFDLGGISEKTPQINKFKLGLGARPYVLAGEFLVL